MAAGRVVHCRKEPYDVYIGRPSKYGNPFIIGRDGDRDEVCDKYRVWVDAHPEFKAMIRRELRGKILGGWCKPKRCHGDYLVQVANEEESE